MSGRAGRWRSGEESRRRILAAARARFVQEGYEQTTVRSIAADAGVDPSMINYFFGGKDKLFAAVLAAPGSPREPLAALLAAGTDGAGPVLVRRFLEVWDATDDPDPLLAVVRSAGRPDLLREFIDREFADQLVGHLEGPDAELRAALISGQLLGLAVARYSVAFDSVASATHDALVAHLGPLVQALLDGPPEGRRVLHKGAAG
ncbi:TetR family transcriptional regulator [Spongiactinospora sp. 9N601]|uniref:TetR/AcrR family transcriptional regulator n=1 Tax=Spongiactinospora sp. 9N601 TaxID=3375149 RepID=UPI0037A76196